MNTQPSAIVDLDGEVWRQIKGFANRCLVSNFARVRTLPKHVKSPDGRSYTRPESLLHPSDSSIRKYKTELYKMLTMETDAGKKMTTYVHRLVALAFVGNPNNKPHVNHIDGNSLNNLPENLEWVTNRENIQHAHDNGLINVPRGERANKAKITNIQAMEIFEMQGEYQTIADMYGISDTSVWGIKSGKYWSSITGKKYTKKYA